ncbi:hypothetical protein FB1_23460 [Flavobacterium branchiophilum NBRC 15030 = ATCC 35035]|nr:hypothetical protein FB1_23460 [Flavobacterium branchiophilum NBRC 15030 = ATCC 35035]
MENSNPNQINSLLKKANKLVMAIKIEKQSTKIMADLIFTFISENCPIIKEIIRIKKGAKRYFKKNGSSVVMV